MASIELKCSHFGLHVIDMFRIEGFYSRVLGFTITDRGWLQRPSGAAVNLMSLSRDPDKHHQIVSASGRSDMAGLNPINQISSPTPWQA